MVKVIKDGAIPRPDREVPGQRSKRELADGPGLHRYMTVFDREGYSVDYFNYLFEKRIAFCTCRKNVREDWPEEEFSEYKVTDDSGDEEPLMLAER
jgi:hypothetical protein